jgi:UDP-N-acetylglucosamine 2-epimerase (non-hydrolysing)
VLDMPGTLGLTRDGFCLATLHRPSNVDEERALRVCLQALGAIARRMPVVLPLHPRTRNRIHEFGLQDLLGPITAIEPLGYTAMLSLTDAAAVVLTDSGGLQEETTALGVPCVTLREQTERPVTVEQGTNRLAPWPLTPAGVVTAFEAAIGAGKRSGACDIEGWDGRAAERVVAALVDGRGC